VHAPDFQARSDRSWTGSATTTWSGSSTRWACARGVDGEVEVLHNSQLGADQQAAFGALVGGLIGLGAAGEEGSELGAERARPARAGGVRLVSESTSPLDLVAIRLAEAEALASVDGDAL
jgi:hypothetical protein